MLTEADQRQLQALEEALLQPGIRRDRHRLDLLLADDFVEIGASGNRYDKAAVISQLVSEPLEAEVLVSGFEARALTDNLALVLYRSDCNGRRALRSSIWRRAAGEGWELLFHQGTLTGPGG